MPQNSFIECAKIINTHGCHGGLKLESWCNSPEDLADLGSLWIRRGNTYNEKKVLKASVFKQFVLVELEGLTDMDAAVALKGQILYARREDFDLDEGEFFIADMIGLPVIDSKNGKIYGKLHEIINRGASDIYVVDTPLGERMIPVVDEFVDRIEIDKGIFVTPIEGMLD